MSRKYVYNPGNNCRGERIFPGREGKYQAGRKIKPAILFLAILFIFSNTSALFGSSITLLEKIEFSPPLQSGPSSPENGFLIKPWAFCVTDDELFIITDFDAGNIKIYERNGKYLELIKVIGRKGYFGKKELANPASCFYNKDEYKLGIMDLGIKKIFIYDRIGRTLFKRVQEIFCSEGATDIQLIMNKLFITGHKASPDSGQRYDFYYVDLTTKKRTFLLPSYSMYGFNSPHKFEEKYYKRHIPAIGVWGFADIYSDNAYFVWEGNLAVITLDIVTGEVSPKTFGYRPPDYVQPHASKKLVEAVETRNGNLLENEIARMSYVTNIFTTPKRVFVIYKEPVTQDSESGSNYRLQFYTLDGNIIKEEPIPGQPSHKMWLDKDKKILYSLSNGSDELGSGVPRFILAYEIQE